MSSLSHLFPEHDEAISAILTAFFDRRHDEARKIHPRYASLWSELARVTLGGGKRLRPKLTLLSYDAFGGNDMETIMPIAAAQEVLHSSLLIHDDIIDRELIRRGSENVMGAYYSRHYAAVADDIERRHFSSSAALLGGDLLLIAAMEFIDTAQVPTETHRAVKQEFHRIIMDVAGGQLLDSEAALPTRSDITAETIARYKTASYSFEGPLIIGAILARASREQLEVLRAYAQAVGIAYQLNDDLISTFGEQHVTGKSNSSDLREGKLTCLVEYFMTHAREADITRFMQTFGSASLSEQDADVLKNLLRQAGAVKYTEQRIQHYEQMAARALDRLSLPQEALDNLTLLIKLSTRREA